MQIAMVSAVGHGRTLLSSSDDALRRCGVYNYNLIALSSIVPPQSTIVLTDHYDSPPDEYGYRLYVVKAEMQSDEPGRVIAAGIGWYQGGMVGGFSSSTRRVARRAMK